MNTEIGVIGKRNEAAQKPPRTVAASEAFADRIAQRYLPSQLSASRAELALAYQVPNQVAYYQNARVDITASPNIHNDFWFQQVASEERTLVKPSAAELPAAALFKRLFSREVRVEVVAPNPPHIGPLPGGSKAKPLTPDLPRTSEPVERVLSRSAPSRAGAQTEGSPASMSTELGWGSPSMPALAPKPFTLAAAEIKRVTEQVIREIDHRTIARRERLGRR